MSCFRKLTIKVTVSLLFHKCARAKVDELQVQGCEINQQIFILDIPMYDSLLVTSNDSLNDLAEEVLGHLLLEHALLGDEIKEVFAGLWVLHDN